MFVSFVKSNKLCPVTKWIQNGQDKENWERFAFPLLPAMEHSILGDEQGKDQGKEPGREGIKILNWTKTKIINELDLGLDQ